MQYLKKKIKCAEEISIKIFASIQKEVSEGRPKEFAEGILGRVPKRIARRI